jgi:O-antigen/teichoic acid export membrane protein
MLSSLTAVVISSTIAQPLINFGPVVVRLLSAEAEQQLAGRFLAAALIARLPIFLFAPVQAVLMPALVQAVLLDDRAAFVNSIRKVFLPAIGLGVLGVLGCAVVGPQLLRLALGPAFELPAGTSSSSPSGRECSSARSFCSLQPSP